MLVDRPVCQWRHLDNYKSSRFCRKLPQVTVIVVDIVFLLGHATVEQSKHHSFKSASRNDDSLADIVRVQRAFE